MSQFTIPTSLSALKNMVQSRKDGIAETKYYFNKNKRKFNWYREGKLGQKCNIVMKSTPTGTENAHNPGKLLTTFGTLSLPECKKKCAEYDNNACKFINLAGGNCNLYSGLNNPRFMAGENDSQCWSYGDKDERVLARHFFDAEEGLNSILQKLKKKTIKIKTLFDSRNNLKSVNGVYEKNKTKMENELYTIDKKSGINKRLIEFYSKDYDLKSNLKVYLKYVYFILLGALVIILINKKLHKNKKIVGFLIFLIIFPLYLLKMIFNLIIDKVGHFKLDILYTFFILVIIGTGTSIFYIVKKIMVMITTPKPFISMPAMPAIAKRAMAKRAIAKPAKPAMPTMAMPAMAKRAMAMPAMAKRAIAKLVSAKPASTKRAIV